VTVVFEHLLGDVAGNIHDGLVAGAALRELCDERMPVVVPTPGDLGIIPNVRPGSLERSDRPLRPEPD
jgi:hypothetical protein